MFALDEKKTYFCIRLKQLIMSGNITKEEIIEQFKGNKILKYTTYVVGGIAVVVLDVLAYQSFISGPKEKASEAEIANGIMYLENDSTRLATEEFEFLVAEYDGYKGGEVAEYAL